LYVFKSLGIDLNNGFCCGVVFRKTRMLGVLFTRRTLRGGDGLTNVYSQKNMKQKIVRKIQRFVTRSRYIYTTHVYTV